MDIDDAVATGTQACLDKVIVFGEIGRVERPAGHIFGKILPSHGQSIDVESIVLR